MTYKLPEGWGEVKLGDAVEVQSGYPFKSKDFCDEGIPVIKIKNIIPPYIDFTSTDFVSESILEDENNYITQYDDILISQTGSTINQINSVVGKVGRVKYHSKTFINQRVAKIYSKDIEYINNDFLYYTVSTNDFKLNLAMKASGSANQANISASQIKDTIINLPPINEQKVIADTLSSLDNKIELNNKTNENLEQQAQVIFKHWFIDFEFPDENGNPYKSSDGEMVESELGMIPKGWEVIKLGDKFNFIKGKVPKYIETTEKDSYPYLTKTVIDGNWSDVKYGLDGTGVKCELLDVLMMMDGSSSSEVFYGHEGLIGSTLALIDAKDGNIREILFMYFNTFHENIKDQNTGSAIPHANKNYIDNIKISIPKSNDIFKKLASTFKLFRVKILRNQIQNQKLSQLRDTLLPKLMSGELRIPLD